MSTGSTSAGRSDGLKSMILIDTPGIASLSEDTSARATRFLTPEESPSSADAVVYLMRHLHASDVRFLEAFRDTAAGAAQTVCAVGVLSRSDEIGSGRIDSLLSAGKVARRYERDGDLASLVLGVIPVAGPRRRGGPHAPRERVHGLPRARRTRARRPGAAPRLGRPLHEGIRRHHAEHRRATRAARPIRHLRRAPGHRAHPRRRRQLVRALRGDGAAERAGRTAAVRARPVPHARVDAQGARACCSSSTSSIRDRPRDGADAIRAGIERIAASAHALRELSLLATARAEGLPLPDADAADAQLIIGGKGTAAHLRLGLPGRRR